MTQPRARSVRATGSRLGAALAAALPAGGLARRPAHFREFVLHRAVPLLAHRDVQVYTVLTLEGSSAA
jgi:hypothetical protein